MSDPKKTYTPLRSDDPIPPSDRGLMDYLLQKILGAGKPASPPGPIDPSQIELLGRHFSGQIMNNPEETGYYQEQVTQPSGRLGKMLSDEERMALMNYLMRITR